MPKSKKISKKETKTVTRSKGAKASAQQDWDFAGWGNSSRVADLGHDPVTITRLGVGHQEEDKLGQWQATAICGNDITSSTLYVSALAIVAAGAWAPVALLVVALVLFFYRRIYAEVGSALPLNGGTYTALLNVTSKNWAAAAACLTLLSYMATAVISAGEAMHYAHNLIPSLNVFGATIALLAFFAFLNILGMAESAHVALFIFVIHMVALTTLAIAGIVTILGDPSLLSANWELGVPSGRGLGTALFLGFAAAMLGISGFESSANFIEEQKEGVFPKTLRNMWVAVSIFNPLICLLALGLLNMSEIPGYQTSLLAEMGQRSAGSWLATFVSIDAVLVLSGAVLTSYVGVIGLVRRMSLDRCLPSFLLKENKSRGTNHWIVLGFFLLSAAVLVLTRGDVGLLAGVYTISFLCVMALYAIANLLLKRMRSRLPRKVKASPLIVVMALIAVLIGLAGNLNIQNLKIFATFFAAVSAAVATMFWRLHLLRLVLFASKSFFEWGRQVNNWIAKAIRRKVKQINEQAVIYFTKGDEIDVLNRAALYVLENEQTNNLIVVNVYEDEKKIPRELAAYLKIIDHLYPGLRIDFMAVRGDFGPELIERLSRRLKVPKNYMFIGTPGNEFPHKLANLGGVRVILG